MNFLITRSSVATFLFSLATLTLIYFNNIILSPFLIIDDYYLISNITDFSSSLDFSRNVDFQPMRNISYLIDYFFYKNFHFKSYVLLNVILLAASGFFISINLIHLMNKLDFKNSLSISLLSLAIITHPIFVSSVCLISGRKYLLAFFFFNLALYSFLNNNFKFSILHYLLACLSHPISIFFLPLIFFIKKDQLNLHKTFISITLFITAAILFINVFIYSDPSPPYPYKLWSSPLVHSLTRFPLILGRYVYNSVVPLNLNVYYSQSSIRSYIGIFLFIIILWKLRKQSQLQTVILLIFGPLFVVLGSLLGTFVTDNYFLTGALLVPATFLFLLPKKNFRLFTLIFWLILNIYLSCKFSALWLSYQSLITHNVQTEPTKKAVQMLLDDYAVQCNSNLFVDSIEKNISLLKTLDEEKNVNFFLQKLLSKHVKKCLDNSCNEVILKSTHFTDQAKQQICNQK
jgi:hypothetical protein